MGILVIYDLVSGIFGFEEGFGNIGKSSQNDSLERCTMHYVYYPVSWPKVKF